MKFRNDDSYAATPFTKKGWFVIILGGMLVLSLLLSPFVLYDKVDENEYGLRYHGWTSSLANDNVYEGGRYYVGLTGSFLTFPSTQQTIQYYTSEGNSVNSRTQDGLEIFLDSSFQYLLQKDAILDIYEAFGTNYEATFWRVARDIIRDVASTYNAIDFFNNRTLIGGVMEESLITEFGGSYNTLIPAFQLLETDLPDTFENALERLEVAKQEIEIATQEQQTALIRAETLIIEAQANAEITILEAEAEAEAFLIGINAAAEAVNITLTAERDAYYALAQGLNLTSSELLAYLWVQALADIGENGNLIIIGENTPELIINEP